jgi:hypothetical protein
MSDTRSRAEDLPPVELLEDDRLLEDMADRPRLDGPVPAGVLSNHSFGVLGSPFPSGLKPVRFSHESTDQNHRMTT